MKREDTKLSDLQRVETLQILEVKFLQRKSGLKSELEDSNWKEIQFQLFKNLLKFLLLRSKGNFDAEDAKEDELKS